MKIQSSMGTHSTRSGTDFYVWQRSPLPQLHTACPDVFRLEPLTEMPPPTCGTCGKYIGPIQFGPPFYVELDFGPGMFEFGDMLDFSADAVLVSDKFELAWRRYGLVGLSGFSQVEVRRIQGRGAPKVKPPTYFHASISRSRAIVDAKASGLVLEGKEEICPECRLSKGIRRAARVMLEPHTWSGEDLFIARGLPGKVLTSQRLKEMAERESLKNVLLLEAQAYTFDHYKGEN